MSTMNVTVVRPERTVGEVLAFAAGHLLNTVGVALIISFLATQVEIVPDFGFVESLSLVLMARLLVTANGYLHWTKDPA